MLPQGGIGLHLLGDVLNRAVPVDNLAGGILYDVPLDSDMPHFAIPADDPVHVIFLNIACIKHPGIVRMDKIPDVFLPGLEGPFPRHIRTEDRIKFIAEFITFFIEMIFPRPEMRQLRRQREHLPAIPQCLRHRFVFSDILIDPVPLLDIARFIFDHIDPDGNGADFPIPPDDAMFKGTRRV